MELGRLAEMEQAQVNHVQKIEKVQESHQNTRINPDEHYKNIAQKPENSIKQNEVILDNVKFGYNSQSKDFFVKITRNNAEYKFPTDEMMRIKAQMMIDAMNAMKKHGGA